MLMKPAANLFALAAFAFGTMHGHAAVPGDKFDLSQWKITLPMDANQDGKVDEIQDFQIQNFTYPPFFFLSKDGGMVFASPNKASTTSGSTNTRSELRQMVRAGKKKIKTKAPKNNFALKANKRAKKFGSIGGRLEASLKVNNVAKRAKYPEKFPAFSVVVGQIHAGKDKELLKKSKGKFGFGNEPIKIYYKKFPDHEKGSVFWNYERNLAKKDPNRTDIAYPVWGNTWENFEDPGEAGVALGEEFSYVINVHENIMYLTFSAENKETVEYQIDLSNNVDAYGEVDELDNPEGYSGDWNYFKAGAYNQCSSKDDPGFWYTACPGSGDWSTDVKNGDFVAVTFTKLVLGDSVPESEDHGRKAK